MAAGPAEHRWDQWQSTTAAVARGLRCGWCQLMKGPQTPAAPQGGCCAGRGTHQAALRAPPGTVLDGERHSLCLGLVKEEPKASNGFSFPS